MRVPSIRALPPRIPRSSRCSDSFVAISISTNYIICCRQIEILAATKRQAPNLFMQLSFGFVYSLIRVFSWAKNLIEDIVMEQAIESKRLLSYIIAEWACSLKYEHLSPEAIQAAKLFCSIHRLCAGWSQQETQGSC